MSAASLPHRSDDAHSADGLDLSTVEGVRAYLAETPFTSTDIAPLSGGTANYVFRLHLSVPHRGKETLVFKHAKPYAKDYHDLAFDLGRQVRMVFLLSVFGFRRGAFFVLHLRFCVDFALGCAKWARLFYFLDIVLLIGFYGCN